MNIDFDVLRKKIQSDFNALASQLNDNFHYPSTSIRIDDSDISEFENNINNLRDSIVNLMCLYDNIPNIVNDISKDTHLVEINFEDEEY